MADTDIYTLRESDPPGRVVVNRNGALIHSAREYVDAAGYLMRVVGLSALVVGDMYADYRADAEERGIL